MPVNLLTQRLKAAKRELTNLKTAHKRGLGNMKVYTKKITIPPGGHETYIWDLIVQVETDPSYAPYPFVGAYPLVDTLNNWGMELTGVFYKSEFLISLHFVWLYMEGKNSFYIVSSAPITNVSWEFRQ